jgi:5-methylcytosine-specific restriction endonuclease McrA
LRGRYRKSRHKHRNPPLPRHMNKTPWGVCRWCAEPIHKADGTVNKRRRWHPSCLHEYLIIVDHRYAKRQVKKRDKGICATCGKYCHYRWEWECDHVIPLIDAPRRRRYWSLDNLQTLCVKCHDKKTTRENKARKKLRRKKKAARVRTR